MQKSETIFWGLVLVSGTYLATSFVFGTPVNVQANANAPVAVNQAAPMQGMGCMTKGGGCGCGGMMKK